MQLQSPEVTRVNFHLTPCDDVIVPTVEYALWLPRHGAGLFGVAVREHVWHPVDLGLSPGRVTLLSLRYGVRRRMPCCEVIGSAPVNIVLGTPRNVDPV